MEILRLSPNNYLDLVCNISGGIGFSNLDKCFKETLTLSFLGFLYYFEILKRIVLTFLLSSSISVDSMT